MTKRVAKTTATHPKKPSKSHQITQSFTSGLGNFLLSLLFILGICLSAVSLFRPIDTTTYLVCPQSNYMSSLTKTYYRRVAGETNDYYNAITNVSTYLADDTQPPPVGCSKQHISLYLF